MTNSFSFHNHRRRMDAAALLSLPTRPENPFPRLLAGHGKSLPLSPPKKFAVVRSAISRTKKEETVETVKTQLQDCSLIAAINYKSFTVKQFRELRRNLPESTTLVVAKNTLVFKAVEGNPWEARKPCLKGMNAWMFVRGEEIPAAIKPYRTFQREKKLDENDFTGAVFEGKFYGPGEVKELESLPTRAEVYAKLLGGLQGPAIGLVSTLQAPARDVVMVLKAFVQKLEEEGGRVQ